MCCVCEIPVFFLSFFLSFGKHIFFIFFFLYRALERSAMTEQCSRTAHFISGRNPIIHINVSVTLGTTADDGLAA